MKTSDLRHLKVNGTSYWYFALGVAVRVYLDPDKRRKLGNCRYEVTNSETPRWVIYPKDGQPFQPINCNSHIQAIAALANHYQSTQTQPSIVDRWTQHSGRDTAHYSNGVSIS